MAGRGAPLGNKNGTRARKWRAALEWALAHAYTPDAIEKVVSAERALYTIALRVVKAALEDNVLHVGGDVDADLAEASRMLGISVQKWRFAVEEIGNRLDGKPVQGVDIGVDPEGNDVPTSISISYVGPAPDGEG